MAPAVQSGAVLRPEALTRAARSFRVRAALLARRLDQLAEQRDALDNEGEHERADELHARLVGLVRERHGLLLLASAAAEESARCAQ